VKVVDCFPFFDEFLILDVRFKELYDLVDKFVIVECEETFTGKPKPLHLSEHLYQRYPQYADKVEIITVSRAQFENQWDREYFQKNHLCKENIQHLGLEDGDLILLSDADYLKLSEELPTLNDLIEKMSSWCKANGKTYKDYAAALRNWAKREPVDKPKKKRENDWHDF
jgi:hypothetical protein